MTARRRHRTALLDAAIGLCAGLAIGFLLMHTAAAPPPPPHSQHVTR